VPEDLIVAVINNDPSGLRRIAANIQAPPIQTGATTPPPPPPMPDIQIKILNGGQLEILDPASGVSLANRNWEQDKPVYYRGLTFTIHGSAVANDNFIIRTDPTRSADNRNALLIAGMASVSIFGTAGGSFQDVYSNVTAKLGTTVNSANMTAAGAAQQASDLKSAYEAKTGVNLDSEASDLIRYQQAYSAAAQVVMAARDMFATILRSF
jgi:flagellar hook-associated protein 1 FlgK